MNFPFTKYSTIYYIISGLLILASVVSLAVFGLKFGIEFTGGSNMEIDFINQRPSNEAIQKQLADFNLGDSDSRSGPGSQVECQNRNSRGRRAGARNERPRSRIVGS